MDLIVEPCSKNINYFDSIDGIILPIEKYSVESVCSFDIEEIIDIKKNNSCKVFVKINKNLFNDDIPEVKRILIELDNNNIDGVFFYDLAILQLKNELNLKIDLVWNQTHMVNNYKTCNYYYDKGVNYALLGKEITLEEIKEIISKSKINSIVEVVSIPSVGFSKRKLLTNYYKDINGKVNNNIKVKEKVTDSFYNVIEDSNGTCFYLDTITNGTSIIKELYDCGCKYILFREYGIDSFDELVSDTKEYISNKCIDNKYIDKYKKLGNSTNFFFRKTIYKVK